MATTETPVRKGRPLGSKNKPKPVSTQPVVLPDSVPVPQASRVLPSGVNPGSPSELAAQAEKARLKRLADYPNGSGQPDASTTSDFLRTGFSAPVIASGDVSPVVPGDGSVLSPPKAAASEEDLLTAELANTTMVSVPVGYGVGPLEMDLVIDEDPPRVATKPSAALQNALDSFAPSSPKSSTKVAPKVSTAVKTIKSSDSGTPAEPVHGRFWWLMRQR